MSTSTRRAIFCSTETRDRALHIHLLIRGIIRVMIVRLYCRLLLEIRIYGYLDRIRLIQGGVGSFNI